jgi:hypothetical protein
MLCRGCYIEVRYDMCPLEELMLCCVGCVTVEVRYDMGLLEELLLCYVGVLL